MRHANTTRQQRSTPVGIILDHGIRLVLAAIFMISGVSKLADPQSFGIIIAAYGILPEALVMPLSLLLPSLEIVAAVGLMLQKRGSLELMTMLMLIFMAVLAYGIYLGLDVDCGCFGPEDPEGAAFHGLQSALYRDVGLLAGIVYLFCRRHLAAMRAGRRTRSAARRKRCASEIS
ncbi:MAG: MauE/DoxX family redox-associated membrane protein [Desulfosarcinaceae bacterium]|nr:MauE/DoxX family redox-associated membrane protein [Desulfosarcinaceae bacterium]